MSHSLSYTPVASRTSRGRSLSCRLCAGHAAAAGTWRRSPSAADPLASRETPTDYKKI